MRLLLDTCVLLWVLGEPEKLRSRFRAQLENRGLVGVVSVVSLWEIAIKTPSGKVRASDDLPDKLSQNRLEILPVNAAHAWRVRSLPEFKDHKDPFDRLLVAQAMVEEIPFATRDTKLGRYGIALVRA